MPYLRVGEIDKTTAPTRPITVIPVIAKMNSKIVSTGRSR